MYYYLWVTAIDYVTASCKTFMPSWEFHFLPTQGPALSSFSIFFIALFPVLKFSSNTFVLCALNVPYTFCLVFAMPLAEFYSLRFISSLILFPNPFCSFILWAQELFLCSRYHFMQPWLNYICLSYFSSWTESSLKV